MTIRQAAQQARKSAHGCRNHQDAMQVLLNGYRQAFPERANKFITLDALWSWVDGYLQMEEASHGPTPLG